MSGSQFARSENNRRSTQIAYDNRMPGGPTAVDDFVTDHSDGARLWLEVFDNMDSEDRLAFMVRCKSQPAHAVAYLHDEAREYLYAFIGSQGLAKAREVWG